MGKTNAIAAVFPHLKALTRYEYILVGTTSANARLVKIVRELGLIT